MKPTDVTAVVICSEFRVANTQTRHHRDDLIDLDEETALRWQEQGFIKILSAEAGWPWGTPGGDLDSIPTEPHPWKRVVACLNIWNDLPDLERTLATWYPHVDHVFAVDGAYQGVPVIQGLSDDGTLEFLAELDKVQIIKAGGFPTQIKKRTMYFEAAEEGDLLFIVDADEYVAGAECLRELPYLDVGWVRYSSPIYRRTQGFPRVFRAQPDIHYSKRHHWIFNGVRAPLTSCQLGHSGLHRMVPIGLDNRRGIARSAGRGRAARVQRVVQVSSERKVSEAPTGGIEVLRILQLGQFDPGMVIFRLHTAINAHSPHTSLMGTRDWERPYKEPHQLHTKDDRTQLREAAERADLIHLHMTYEPFLMLGVQTEAPIIIHHHGTRYREAHDKRNMEDEVRAALRLCSNPELLRYPGTDDMHYLPNPVPVARYQHLVASLQAPRSHPGFSALAPFRIAHSPSKRELKGTTEFLGACWKLREQGLNVEPVLIEKTTHYEALRIKATCHAMFDSFFLGLQCSGLEAAAMGLPVIAGDEEVQNWHLVNGADVPYSYANTQAELEATIERLVVDRQFYEEEADRVFKYTLRTHDYGAVVARYLDILDDRFDWRKKHTIGTFHGRLTR